MQKYRLELLLDLGIFYAENKHKYTIYINTGGRILLNTINNLILSVFLPEELNTSVNPQGCPERPLMRRRAPLRQPKGLRKEIQKIKLTLQSAMIYIKCTFSVATAVCKCRIFA